MICGNWLGIGLPYRDAGPGCLLVRVGWDLWRPDAGLVEMKSGGFVDDVDRMGKWPGYGGYAVAMGEWPAYGDLVWRMGRCVRRVAVWGNRDTIWGDGLCGGPLNRMGSRENVWGSGAHGDLRGVGYSVWPARCGIADFAVFCELPKGDRCVWGPSAQAYHKPALVSAVMGLVCMGACSSYGDLWAW